MNFDIKLVALFLIKNEISILKSHFSNCRLTYLFKIVFLIKGSRLLGRSASLI